MRLTTKNTRTIAGRRSSGWEQMLPGPARRPLAFPPSGPFGLASNCRHLGFLAWGLSPVSGPALGPLCLRSGRPEVQSDDSPLQSSPERGLLGAAESRACLPRQVGWAEGHAASYPPRYSGNSLERALCTQGTQDPGL